MTTRRIAKHEWVEGRLPPDPSGEPDGRVLTVSDEKWVAAPTTPPSLFEALEDRFQAWDTFNREGPALGVSDSGHTWTDLGVGDGFIVGGGQQSGRPDAALTSLTDATPSVAVLGLSLVDVDVQGWVYGHDNARPGFVFRLQDSENYLRATVRRDGQAQLSVVEDGTETVLAEATTILGGLERRRQNIRVVARGSAVEVFVNGARAIGHTMTGFAAGLGAGDVGMTTSIRNEIMSIAVRGLDQNV